MLSSSKNIVKEGILGTRIIDLEHVWDVGGKNFPLLKNIQEFLTFYEQKNLQNNYYTNPNIIYTSDQEMVLNLLDNQLNNIKNNKMNNNIIKRSVIQEKAGSGKSTLINEIISRIRSVLGDDAVAVAATTGAAAGNVDGKTLHNLLKFPYKAFKIRNLAKEIARRYQLELKALPFLIIDEMSMIGGRLLHNIDARFQELFLNNQEVCGGLIIYMFGDFRQLPPVKDVALFHNSKDDIALKGITLFKTFELYHKLQHAHRQSTDSTGF